MLHSFFFYEAERAFRWCVKLEPDNAMAYWGLARATEDRRTKEGERAVDFLREAVKRKAQVSERERLYIEAWEAVLLPDPLAEKDKDPRHYTLTIRALHACRHPRIFIEFVCQIHRFTVVFGRLKGIVHARRKMVRRFDELRGLGRDLCPLDPGLYRPKN